jgi:hypothetical protein
MSSVGYFVEIWVNAARVLVNWHQSRIDECNNSFGLDRNFVIVITSENSKKSQEKKISSKVK